jgi:hypothetical protein
LRDPIRDYPITPQKLLKSLDLVVYIENGWSLVSYIPNDEKEKWKQDLKLIITEIDRLEDGAKM